MRNLFRFGKKRDPDPFMSLVEPHLDLMYRMAWRWTRHPESAEDLVQDVLVRLLPRQAELERVDRLRPWLIRVLYRRFVDVHRRQRAAPVDTESTHRADDTLFEDRIEQVADDSDALLRLEQQQILDRALDDIDAGQRDTVTLHYIEGYAVTEVAEILEVSVGTVKSRLHRARRHLREILASGEPSGSPVRVEK